MLADVVPTASRAEAVGSYKIDATTGCPGSNAAVMLRFAKR
jgi:hypothetical protein